VRLCGEIGPTASQVLGLREVRAHLLGDLGRDACIAALAQATRHYAKRQMTWFRRESALEMIDTTALPSGELIDRLVAKATAVIEP